MKPDGGPAFPAGKVAVDAESMRRQDGMTLRDYFAATATDGDVADMQDSKPTGYISRACARFMHADAMLRERKT